MKLKAKAQDFQVRELLDERVLHEQGRWRVYRVTKRKLTTLEAAAELARRTGVTAADVGMCGLKDRQGVTTQFMSVRGGRNVFMKTLELRIETAGFATAPLTSESSLGNTFEITVRGVTRNEIDELERNAEAVREHGLPNYFGEQRFGNLAHGQGWIARDLALGRHEVALRALMCSHSERDDARHARFKRGVDAAWGDWRACRELAGQFGAHHSVFEHLAHEPGDFAGAFTFVGSKLRLIHLYAWQSHLWNRAVARFVESQTTRAERIVVPTPEGVIAFPRGALQVPAAWNGRFRLPGDGFDDVHDGEMRDLLVLALREEGLQPSEFRIEGISGFQLKGEDRELFVKPRHIRYRVERGGKLVVTFDLPRGSYATLVMARLVPPRTSARNDERTDERNDERNGQRVPGRGEALAQESSPRAAGMRRAAPEARGQGAPRVRADAADAGRARSRTGRDDERVRRTTRDAAPSGENAPKADTAPREHARRTPRAATAKAKPRRPQDKGKPRYTTPRKPERAAQAAEAEAATRAAREAERIARNELDDSPRAKALRSGKGAKKKSGASKGAHAKSASDARAPRTPSPRTSEQRAPAQRAPRVARPNAKRDQPRRRDTNT